MKNDIDYETMLKICYEINEKYIPTEDGFDNKVDQLFENEGFEGFAFILNSFKELLHVVDAEITKIEEKVHITPTCEIGCANCCYFPIIVTKLEGKLMVEFIRNLPRERKSKIVSHLYQYQNQYREKIDELCSIDFEEVPDFKEQYITKQLPCPLLDVDTNQCLAYDVRPIPCRTYLNYCNPTVCKENFIPKEPFSYEFLREYYMEALAEIVETVLYEEKHSFGIQFPDDLFELDYLPKLLKIEHFSKNTK